MKTTDGNAANAQPDTPSIENTHDLRLTTLLFDLVEARGRRGAAEVLDVSHGALARAGDTGRLTGRMRDALTRHLLEGGTEVDKEHSELLAGLERRVAELEEGKRERPEVDEVHLAGLQEALMMFGKEQERHGRRIAALESRGPKPVAERPTPVLPMTMKFVSLHPDPGDDAKRFGAVGRT